MGWSRFYVVSLARESWNPVVVVVAHVVMNEPPQMLFLQRDDIVKNLPAAASDRVCRWDHPRRTIPRVLNKKKHLRWNRGCTLKKLKGRNTPQKVKSFNACWNPKRQAWLQPRSKFRICKRGSGCFGVRCWLASSRKIAKRTMETMKKRSERRSWEYTVCWPG